MPPLMPNAPQLGSLGISRSHSLPLSLHHSLASEALIIIGLPAHGKEMEGTTDLEGCRQCSGDACASQCSAANSVLTVGLHRMCIQT